MKELEKIEKVLFENVHVMHYPDEYKNVARKIHKKVFVKLEKERYEHILANAGMCVLFSEIMDNEEFASYYKRGSILEFNA